MGVKKALFIFKTSRLYSIFVKIYCGLIVSVY